MMEERTFKSKYYPQSSDREVTVRKWDDEAEIQTRDPNFGPLTVSLTFSDGEDLGRWLLDHCAAAPVSPIPVCPKCETNKHVELSLSQTQPRRIWSEKTMTHTHYCQQCVEWFTPVRGLPWTCTECGLTNPPDAETCLSCHVRRQYSDFKKLKDELVAKDAEIKRLKDKVDVRDNEIVCLKTDKDTEIERLKRCCADQQDFFRIGCQRADEWKEKYHSAEESRDDLRKRNEELRAEVDRLAEWRTEARRMEQRYNETAGHNAALREALKAADVMRSHFIRGGCHCEFCEGCHDKYRQAYDLARAKCSQGETPQGEVKSGEYEVPVPTDYEIHLKLDCEKCLRELKRKGLFHEEGEVTERDRKARAVELLVELQKNVICARFSDGVLHWEVQEGSGWWHTPWEAIEAAHFDGQLVSEIEKGTPCAEKEHDDVSDTPTP